MQYNQLPDEKIKEIAKQEFTRQSKTAHSVELPKYVAIAGQAGAGKTAASQMVRDELRQKGGSIHLDTDIMRETLPLYGKKPPAEETQRDAGKIVDELRALAIEKLRLHLRLLDQHLEKLNLKYFTSGFKYKVADVLNRVYEASSEKFWPSVEAKTLKVDLQVKL